MSTCGDVGPLETTHQCPSYPKWYHTEPLLEVTVTVSRKQEQDNWPTGHKMWLLDHIIVNHYNLQASSPARICLGICSNSGLQAMYGLYWQRLQTFHQVIYLQICVSPKNRHRQVAQWKCVINPILYIQKFFPLICTDLAQQWCSELQTTNEAITSIHEKWNRLVNFWTRRPPMLLCLHVFHIATNSLH